LQAVDFFSAYHGIRSLRRGSATRRTSDGDAWVAYRLVQERSVGQAIRKIDEVISVFLAPIGSCSLHKYPTTHNIGIR
jgi:hypothetical protein